MFSDPPTPLRLTVRAPIGTPSQGTAWLIDWRYVVTAFHVVSQKEEWYHEIFGSEQVRYELELGRQVIDLSRLPAGRHKDVVVFDLSLPVTAEIRSASMFDRLDSDPIVDAAYKAEGYWAMDPRGPQPRRGKVLKVEPDRLILSVDDGTQIDWGGLSGSAVTQGRWVVGLLTSDVVAGRRTYAAPVSHIEAAMEQCLACRPASHLALKSDNSEPFARNAYYALFEIVARPFAWAHRVRVCNPRLSPDFALVHLTEPQRDNPAVRELLRCTATAAATLLLPTLAFFAVLRPSNHAEYYLRHLCLTETSVLIAGATVAVVSSVAAGVGAACVAALAGAVATRVAIEFTHRGHPGPAVAMGTFLGTTAAIAAALDAPRRRRNQGVELTRMAVDCAYAGVVLGFIGLVVWVVSRLMAPEDRQHDISNMALAGMCIGIVIGGVVAWAARNQRQRRSVLPGAADEWKLITLVCVPYVAAGMVGGALVVHVTDQGKAPEYGVALGLLAGSFVASVLGAMQVISEKRAGGGASRLFAAVAAVAVFVLLLTLGVFVAFPGRVETVWYVGTALVVSFSMVRGLGAATRGVRR